MALSYASERALKRYLVAEYRPMIQKSLILPMIAYFSSSVDLGNQINKIAVLKSSPGTYMIMVCVFRLNAEALIRLDSHSLSKSCAKRCWTTQRGSLGHQFGSLFVGSELLNSK